ncbi:MAG: DNA repair protein RecN, partial [Firmicutes bacterium]|nr:DNA repair protein RecN [Bacillota bacterium]
KVGQHQLLRAASPQYVLDWVDQYGRLGELRSACGAAYRDFRSAEAAVSALESLARDLPQLDEKRQLREELASYQFQEDEDEAIQKDMTRLRAGRKLMETSRDLYQLLEGTGPQAGLLADVAEARRLADTLASYDATVENMARSVAEVEQILGDVRLEVSRWMDGLDLDPARLEQLEARADLISRMKRRYGPELRDVLEFVESLGQEIARLDNLDWEMRQLVRKRDEAQSQLLDAAETLSRARQDILGRAAEELTERIREMEMPTGELVMRRSPAPVTTRGVDLVEIYFSASQGQALKPLAKVASGGELARVALALAVTGQGDDVMVHLFDEVDQGLGGASAERVGRLLAELGRGAQVLAVSHQPVVAARADHHLRVSKSVVGSRSESTAAPVSDSGRVREIARMLSGSQDDIAMEHAESLLKDKPGAAG